MTKAFRADNVDLDPERARALIDGGEVQLVDVREPYEWEAGRIPGDVRHVPLGELTGQAATIDRDTPVVFSCRSGARSLMAAQAFRASGYDAYSMAGGLVAWDAAGLPVDGTVAEH